MTATLEDVDLASLTFDAQAIARAWLSVSLAASDDDARPALTGLHIEFYAEGVRLVATDSYMLLRSWVPTGGHGDEDPAEPLLDEAPLATATALDVYDRGAGLMRHMLKLATAKNAPPYDVKVSVGTDPRADAEPSFDGMERTYAILDVPDQEVLTLPLYEGEWPNWRHVWAEFRPETTSEINFAPELIVARLGKLGKLHDEGILRWCFGGPERPALIELRPSRPSVAGLVMPVKVHLPDLGPTHEDVTADSTSSVSDVVDAVVDAVNNGALGPDVTATTTKGKRATPA